MAQWVEYLLAFMQPWLVSFPAPHEPSVAGCMISVLRLGLGNWRTRGVQHHCHLYPKFTANLGYVKLSTTKQGVVARSSNCPYTGGKAGTTGRLGLVVSRPTTAIQ